MTKSELKTGMIVTLRNGHSYVVFKDVKTRHRNGDVIVRCSGATWTALDNYKEDLTSGSNSNLDIMRIETLGVVTDLTIPDKAYSKHLIWERAEPKELTVAEIEAILGYPIKVVK